MDDDSKTIINGLVSKIYDCLTQLPDYGIQVFVRPIWTDGKKGIWIEISNITIDNGKLHYSEE